MNQERYPIFGADEQIKIRGWLSGRGVNVWRNVNLSDPNVGTFTFTPNYWIPDVEDPDLHQKAPHWRFGTSGPVEIVRDDSRFLFFDATSVMKTFSLSRRGLNAAWKEIGRILFAEGEYPREVPIGTLHVKLTVEPIDYVTTRTRGMVNGQTTPLDTMGVYGIVRYVAIEHHALREVAPHEGAA